MAKIYSLFLLFLLSIPSLVKSQNVGIGTNDPKEKLDVDGAIRIGNTSNNNIGTIRYNFILNTFEGRTDTGWVNLLGGGGADSAWIVDGINMYSGVLGNVGVGVNPPMTKFHVKGLGGPGIRTETSSNIYPALDVINTDSAGYALKVTNTAAVGQIGGNSARFIGDVSLEGALRNDNSTLYGGSVAVNDGLTVGNIAGATCLLTNTKTISIWDTSFSWVVFGPNNPYGPKMIAADDGDCRQITNVYFQVTLNDQEDFFMKNSIQVRGVTIGAVESDANPSISGFQIGVPPLDTFWKTTNTYTSIWSWNSANWNGQDPAGTSWDVNIAESNGDGDFIFGFKLQVSYKYGDSANAPIYAAFGDIRASGTLYANSTNPYGDVAEFFKVDESSRKPEPGDIVSISRQNPQAFVLTNREYDPLLAGVISENPSVFLNDPSEGEPIALTGRVKVKVNLEGGAIKPGDAITSSSVVGVGKKAARDGIIIGHALETFDGARTDEGKIWILLGKGHVAKVAKHASVKEIDAPEVHGFEIKGVTRVNADEETVFVPWKKSMAAKMPTDVEFEDLYIDLTPFGGQAQMTIKEVNAEGFTVNVSEKTAGFKGFYYTTEILYSAFEKETVFEKIPTVSFENYEDKLAYATELNKRYKDSFQALQHKSGFDFSEIANMRSVEEVKTFKRDAAENWKKNHPDLFASWQNAGMELSQLVNQNASLSRKLNEK